MPKSTVDGSVAIRGEKSSRRGCLCNGREALEKRCLFKHGNDVLFRDRIRVYGIRNRLLDGSGLHHGPGTKAHHSDAFGRKIGSKTSQERFYGPKGSANGTGVWKAPSGDRCDKQDDPRVLLDHMSCGCTCCDELRGDESGQRQQKLLKGKLHRAGRVAIVFCLWTHHIQEDINPSPLLCHAIEISLHALLIL